MGRRAVEDDSRRDGRAARAPDSRRAAPPSLRSVAAADRARLHRAALEGLLIWFRHSGAMRSIEPGISRFRVRSFGPSRNDENYFFPAANASATAVRMSATVNG